MSDFERFFAGNQRQKRHVGPGITLISLMRSIISRALELITMCIKRLDAGMRTEKPQTITRRICRTLEGARRYTVRLPLSLALCHRCSRAPCEQQRCSCEHRCARTIAAEYRVAERLGLFA